LLRLRRERVELTDPWLDDLTVDYDEDERWVVVHRGALRLACNLGADPVTVPVGGSPVLWWEPPKQDETASATIVPGHSFVVLDASRTVASG
jgi:maltooligosyltrehalose trehalohydrolase